MGVLHKEVVPVSGDSFVKILKSDDLAQKYPYQLYLMTSHMVSTDLTAVHLIHLRDAINRILEVK